MVLSAAGLSFSYGRAARRPVFEGLEWVVAPGATTLLLGRNGAGKSTLLQLLAGELRPNRGKVSIHGDDSKEALYRNVCWMPQDAVAVPSLTVREQLEFSAWVAGGSRRECLSKASDALELIDLTAKSEAKSTSLSGGQLRRLALGQAWVRGGEVLLLDEPTAGLDPAQTRRFRTALESFDFPGGIVISTHQVADAADHVDRVTVLDSGVIAFDGTRDSFVAHGRARGIRSGDLSGIFAALVGDDEP